MRLFFLSLFTVLPLNLFAESGNKAADQYMSQSVLGTSANHYMAVHFGAFTEGNGYYWGSNNKCQQIGRYTFGVTYRISEIGSSFDWLFRGDFTSYEIGSVKPLLLSLMPMVIFPEASSQFPLYFGFGIGPGIFFRQLSRESTISIDYQLLMGGRLFNIFGNIGFFLEAGLKNHINLLSDGQFNGVFIALGSLFVF